MEATLRGSRPAPLAIALGVGGAILLAMRPTTLSLGHGFLAVVTIWVGLVPSLLYLAIPPERRPIFPLMALTGIYFAIFFGLAGFLGELLRGQADGSIGWGAQARWMREGKIHLYGGPYIDGVSYKAQGLILGGMVATLIAYYVFSAKIWPRVPTLRFLPTDADDRRLVVLWAGIGVLHFAFFLFPVLHSLPSVDQLRQPSGFIFFSMGLALWLKRRISAWIAVIVGFVLLPIEILMQAKSGFLTTTILLVVVAASIWMWVRRTVPWRIMLALSVCFVLIYPVLPAYRGVAWNAKGDASTLDTLKKFSAQVSAGLSILADGNLRQPSIVGLTGTLQRLCHLALLAHVVEQTPRNVPYWRGETYKPLVTSSIPRFLWKDKPEERAGYEFGTRYGLIPESEKWHSINLPWTVEMYANFGSAGVLVGMTLLGILLAFLERIFVAPTLSLPEAAFGAAMIARLWFQDANFSLMTGSLLTITILFWVYFWAGMRFPFPGLRRGEKRPSASDR